MERWERENVEQYKWVRVYTAFQSELIRRRSEGEEYEGMYTLCIAQTVNSMSEDKMNGKKIGLPEKWRKKI